MPPKVKFEKNAVVAAAFEVVRKRGWAGLTARSIAEELNSSTGPIYTHLKSMKTLEDKILKKAFEILLSYQTTQRTKDIFLNMGIGYVLFAKEEKHLFRCINDEKYNSLNREYHEKIFKALGQKLSAYPIVKGLPQDQVDRFLLQGWTYSHGLASLVNKGFYQEITDDEITELVTYTGLRFAQGFKEMLTGTTKGHL